MDELNNIHAFIRVVESGSFSAAGRELNRSTSSIARQIEWLEEALGVSLINRNTRNHALTEAGKFYYERVKLLTKQLAIAKAETRSTHENVQGFLRVALRTSLATTVIVPALPDLLLKYPDLQLEIIISDDRPDLVANNIDIAMWVGELADSELVARRLTPSHRVLCASPEYFAKHGMPTSPRELKHHSCLLFKAKSYGSSWTFHKGDEAITVPVRGNLISDNGLVLVSAAIGGLGMIVMPDYVVREHLTTSRLQRVLPEYDVRPALTPAPLYVVFPHSRRQSMRVRVFIDFLVSLFGAIDD